VKGSGRRGRGGDRAEMGRGKGRNWYCNMGKGVCKEWVKNGDRVAIQGFSEIVSKFIYRQAIFFNDQPS
jgi:hypothetical protein